MSGTWVVGCKERVKVEKGAVPRSAKEMRGRLRKNVWLSTGVEIPRFGRKQLECIGDRLSWMLVKVNERDGFAVKN